MGKRWFYQGFLRVSLMFLLPGPGGAGRAEGDMRFVVHLEMSILPVLQGFITVFEVTVSSSRPAPGGAMARPL